MSDYLFESNLRLNLSLAGCDKEPPGALTPGGFETPVGFLAEPFTLSRRHVPTRF
jgi:hypothetical protein